MAKDATAKHLAHGLPLAPIDRRGEPIEAGDLVVILSVESCASGLAGEEQERLRALVDERRRIVRFDRWGFVWLAVDARAQDADFCLFPNEVSRVGRPHGE